jgi:hypothetical protein
VRPREGECRVALLERLGAQRVARVAHEVLVVEEDRGDVVVTRDEPDRSLAVDAGLADNRVVLAHLREDAGRIRAQLGAIEVVLALRRGHHRPA